MRQHAEKMTDTLRREQRRYEGDDDRPLGSYAAVLATYGGSIAALLAIGRLAGRRLPRTVSVLDLLLMCATTHKASRTIAKDPVTSPIRAPFTRYQGVAGPSELAEDIREESGPRHAVGELLACPFCMAQWVATAYGAGMVFAPRLTRLAGVTMTAVAVSDWLQLAYTRLQKSAQA